MQLLNKKGLELAINTIVILILAVILLIFLVLFFTETGKNFLVKVRGYSNEANIDEIVRSCNILADTNSIYEFCCVKKIIKYYVTNDSIAERKLSCDKLSNISLGNEVKKLNCDEVSC